MGTDSTDSCCPLCVLWVRPQLSPQSPSTKEVRKKHAVTSHHVQGGSHHPHPHQGVHHLHHQGVHQLHHQGVHHLPLHAPHPHDTVQGRETEGHCSSGRFPWCCDSRGCFWTPGVVAAP